jgi:hypothetical protein
MTEKNTLAPTCAQCGAAESTSWVMITGTAKVGLHLRSGRPASTLLCADCQTNYADALQEFIDGLQDGYSRMDQGPDVTVLTYGDGRQEVYPMLQEK